MIPIMALRAVTLAALAGVQGLSVVSAGDRTHVLIEADARVSYEHQMLSNPPRIVVDIAGAEFDLPRRQFTGINRGGVLALRSSQFQPGVVRVVVDLAQAVEYEVEQSNGLIRVSFPNPSGAFESWSSGEPVSAPAPAARPRNQPLGEPVDEPVRPRPRQPDRPVAQVPVSRPPVVEAPVQEQPRISVEFRNTPILDVLGTFADFSDMSIVPGQGVTNQVITAKIQRQPWDEAMRAILEGQGLTATELQSGIIMVTSLEQQRQLETQEQTVTQAFQLQYVSADSVAPQVRQLLAQGEGADGTVAVNRATNSVIVSARRSVVERIGNLVPTLDRRTPQVTVQVRILSVSRANLEALGVHYEFKETDPPGAQINQFAPGIDGSGLELAPPSEQVDLRGDGIAALGNAQARLSDPGLSVLATLVLGRHTLLTWIDAVEELRLAELQADPVVTVLDHRTARVHVGERTPIRVVDPGSAGAQGPQAQVRTEETGVILQLTPHVVGTDQVLLALHAERSDIGNVTPDGSSFTFNTQETDTEILLNDGETAVISGLTTTDLREEFRGIPILMDLPVLGALFRTTRREQEKDDLLIMVTPYIDRAGGF